MITHLLQTHFQASSTNGTDLTIPERGFATLGMALKEKSTLPDENVARVWICVEEALLKNHDSESFSESREELPSKDLGGRKSANQRKATKGGLLPARPKSQAQSQYPVSSALLEAVTAERRG